MSDIPNSGLELRLPGVVLSCDLDGRNDARLLRYLSAALEDARAALAEGLDGGQALEWKLGQAQAKLAVDEGCADTVLARALQHVGLLAGDSVPAASRPTSQSAGMPAAPVESPAQATTKEAPASDGSNGDAPAMPSSQPSPAERNLPAFADLDEAVEAMRDTVMSAGHSALAERHWQVVADYYGLSGPAKSYDELASALDLTKQSIAQSLVRSLKHLAADRVLVGRLKATLNAHGEAFWDWLDEHCGGLVDGERLESLPRELEAALNGQRSPALTRWYLCFMGAYLDGSTAVQARRTALTEWMGAHGREVAGCFVSPHLDGEELGRALEGIERIGDDWRLPQTVAFLAERMGVSTEILERVLELRSGALKLAVEDGLVSSSRAGVHVQRAHRLSLMMAVEYGARETGLFDLAERYVQAFPDDPADPRNVYLAVGDPRGSQHLFQPGAVTGWRSLYRGNEPELLLEDLKAQAQVNANPSGNPAADPTTDTGESKLPANFVTVLGLLKRHGPMSNVELGRKMAAEDGQQASLVGLPIHQSGRIVRLGPKIYGLPEHRQAIVDGKLLPEAFLDGTLLAVAAYGLRTGEARFFYPCWNDSLVGALQAAAEERRAELPLSWARIIDPDYNVGNLYGEPITAPGLVARKAGPDLILSTCLHLAEHGCVSAAALNLAGRSRAEAMTADGTASLGAMAALGIVAGDRPWYEAQKPGPLAAQAREAMTIAKARTGDLDWNQPEAKALLKEARKYARDAQIEWLARGAAAKVLEKV